MVHVRVSTDVWSSCGHLHEATGGPDLVKAFQEFKLKVSCKNALRLTRFAYSVDAKLSDNSGHNGAYLLATRSLYHDGCYGFYNLLTRALEA